MRQPLGLWLLEQVVGHARLERALVWMGTPAVWVKHWWLDRKDR